MRRAPSTEEHDPQGPSHESERRSAAISAMGYRLAAAGPRTRQRLIERETTAPVRTIRIDPEPLPALSSWDDAAWDRRLSGEEEPGLARLSNGRKGFPIWRSIALLASAACGFSLVLFGQSMHLDRKPHRSAVPDAKPAVLAEAAPPAPGARLPAAAEAPAAAAASQANPAAPDPAPPSIAPTTPDQHPWITGQVPAVPTQPAPDGAQEPPSDAAAPPPAAALAAPATAELPASRMAAATPDTWGGGQPTLQSPPPVTVGPNPRLAGLPDEPTRAAPRLARVLPMRVVPARIAPPSRPPADLPAGAPPRHGWGYALAAQAARPADPHGLEQRQRPAIRTAAAHYELPRWLTEDRPEHERELIMSPPPHNLDAPDAGTAAAAPVPPQPQAQAAQNTLPPIPAPGRRPPTLYAEAPPPVSPYAGWGARPFTPAPAYPPSPPPYYGYTGAMPPATPYEQP